ncbi:MAG: rubrerythrin family protein [Candidatus Brocadiia bacterium]
MSTSENLKEAFAGESQANRKYLAFAKKADQEGYAQVARLFRAAAAAETVHAHAHLDVMGGVQDTAANLQAAIAGEGAEFQEMYPAFVEEAKSEGNERARESFEYAMAVEEIHHGLYTEAAKAVDAGSDLPPRSLFVCRCCGNTVYDAPPEECPVCGSPRSWFDEVA